jgi:hypothetical protein
MAGYSFIEGMHIELGGRELVVEEKLPNGDLRVLNIAFDESRSEKKEDLVKALFAGELKFLGDSSTTQVEREQARRFVEDFTIAQVVSENSCHSSSSGVQTVAL